MHDIKNQVIGAYRNWVGMLRGAKIPERYWLCDRDVVINAIVGDPAVINDMYDRPQIWTKGHFVIIDGFTRTERATPSEVRDGLAFALMVAAASYFVTREDSVGHPTLKWVDFGRFQTALDSRSHKEDNRRGDFEDICSAELLFVSEAKRTRSTSSTYYADRIDEVVRTRHDKTTIMSFADGCTQSYNDGSLGRAMGELLSHVYASATSYNKPRNIYRIATKPMGVEENGEHDA